MKVAEYDEKVRKNGFQAESGMTNTDEINIEVSQGKGKNAGTYTVGPFNVKYIERKI